MRSMLTTIVLAAAWALGPVFGPAWAQKAAVPNDPQLPAALRAQAPTASPRGEALELLVREKLKARFAAVDASGSGLVTRDQALGSKWPVLAEHFDEIDVQRRGAVRFDEVLRYLHSRRAAR
jgi:hypothetical protein